MATRLQKFSVTGLFGLYSHTINLCTDLHITAIIGPNGLGKTVCLKLIEALFARNYSFFLQVQFESAEYVFTSGEVVLVKQTAETIRLKESPKHRYGGDAQQNPFPHSVRSIEFTYKGASGSHKSWKPVNFEMFARRMRRWPERNVPWLRQIAPEMWIDERNGRRYATEELSQFYPRLLQRELFQSSEENAPQDFTKLISQNPCHLIETQRLLVLPTADDDEPWNGVHGRGTQSQLVVQKKAETLREIIQSVLSQYANLSQSRDRTFPQRVISETKQKTLTEQQLRDRLQSLDDQRQSLINAGILDADIEPVTFEEGFIQASLFPVLEIYIRDNEEKLKVFDALLAKINVFRKIVNGRFLDKKLEIDRKTGFRITNSAGREVPVDKLSSGEQHQLVIAFDLLFEVKENSLILIDEPELSLHVIWQKAFVGSLTEIIKLNPFDVVLATHSPLVVSRHHDIVVELGDVGDLGE